MSEARKTVADGEFSDVRGEVGRLSRLIAACSRSGDLKALDEPGRDLLQLLSVLDPDVLDTTSPNYAFGAVDAFSSVLNALAEQMVSQSTIELLLRKPRPRVFAAVAADAGLTQTALSSRLNMKASNLSGYIRELAQVGLIEATLPASGRGKAWRLSPWGNQVFLDMLTMLSSSLSSSEFSDALRAVVSSPHGVPTIALPETTPVISKREYYSRVEAALEVDTSEPLRLSTLYAGDLRSHARPWKLHEKVFSRLTYPRPIELLFVSNPDTRPWIKILLQRKHEADPISLYLLPERQEPTATVQVLDEEGLLYPIPPRDSSLIIGRGSALEDWSRLRGDLPRVSSADDPIFA
jgi:DNA-binding MarR family transcriptional regulator